MTDLLDELTRIRDWKRIALSLLAAATVVEAKLLAERDARARAHAQQLGK